MLIRRFIFGALLGSFWTLPGQSQLTCARVDTPGLVRAEGLAEMLPDIVLDCKGGKAGASASYSLLVTVRGEWATRGGPTKDSPKAKAWNEALLVVDDPEPAKQIPCLPSADFSSCSVPAAIKSPANVFPVRQLQTNLLAFANLPIVAPGDGKTRRLRVTNLRVNAIKSVYKDSSIYTSLQMFDPAGNPVPVGPPETLSARLAPSLEFSLADATGKVIADPNPALLVIPSALPKNDPVSSIGFQAIFRESSKTAFRRRNVATIAADPGIVQGQSAPGLLYSTESGFSNDSFPSTSLISQAGVASSGTRLRLTIENIPANVLVWASIRDVSSGTVGFDETNPKALLTYTNPNGDGPFSPMSPWIPGWARLYIDNFSASAVWEVVSADPGAIDQIAVAIAITSQGTPSIGTATLRGSIAPFAEQAVTPAATFLSVVPRFQIPVEKRVAFKVSNSIQNPPVTFASAASLSGSAIAPGSFAAAFGTNLSAIVAQSAYPWPTTLNGIQVQIVDATGIPRLAPILMVSPTQVNYLVPDGVRTGAALVNILGPGGSVAGSGLANIQTLAPGLFSADGSGRGAASGTFLTLTSSGSNEPQPLGAVDPDSGVTRPVPIPLADGAPVYLSLFGTGIRARSDLGVVTATLGGQEIPVLYAGPQSDQPGLDEINLGPLPLSLQGRGELDLVITVDGQEANRLKIAIQ